MVEVGIMDDFFAVCQLIPKRTPLQVFDRIADRFQRLFSSSSDKAAKAAGMRKGDSNHTMWVQD